MHLLPLRDAIPSTSTSSLPLQHSSHALWLRHGSEKITTYDMLTPERRYQIEQEIRTRRDARIAVGLPLDSLESEEEEQAEEEGEDVISKARVQDKVNFFGWQVATNSLATKRNLFRRTIVKEDVCGICGMEREDEFHAVIICTKSKAMCSALRAKWEILKECEFRFTCRDWLQMLLLKNPEMIRSRILLILWKAWHLRNNIVHGDGRETVRGSVQQLIRLEEDVHTAMQKEA